ncbi:hypothetical protein A9G13_00565 [Gilliamella sp. wkB178]|uniref:hypothetical protein n=1 Tax=Gilliamella sp. wkB178 TaxID=3120259 RepID=UPI00080DC672|nr:hypothetical protein [Gilliamella apicola]OCG10265.1 hypothetical protein A9G13_00565 [Gilliamella apicola]
MALPSEFRTEKTNFFEQELKKFQVDELENLTDEDFRILGMYIQTYNFMDLNIQRCINILKDEKILFFDKKERQDIPNLIDKIIDCLDKLDLEKEQEIETMEKLIEIKFRRNIRNLFAHFACKRIPNQDAFVFMSNPPKDIKKFFKREQIHVDLILYSILDIADARGLINHVLKYETWLAKFTLLIINKYNSSK